MEGDDVKSAKESLSQFLARVLDQLSITSWFPALMLVAIALVLSQVAIHKGSFQDAFGAIGHMGTAGIVFLVAAVVVAAMFAQAFEFEAIRIIEGYWPQTGPLGGLTRWRRAAKLKKLDQLTSQLSRAASIAVLSARRQLRLKEQLGSGGFDALEAYVVHVPQLGSTTAEDKANAKRLIAKWKQHGDPVLVNRLEEVEVRLNEIPSLSLDAPNWSGGGVVDV